MLEQGEGSWMSNEFPPRLLQHPDLKHIRDGIMGHFRKFMYEVLKCDRQTNAIFTTSWLAALDKGGYIPLILMPTAGFLDYFILAMIIQPQFLYI